MALRENYWKKMCFISPAKGEQLVTFSEVQWLLKKSETKLDKFRYDTGNLCDTWMVPFAGSHILQIHSMKFQPKSKDLGTPSNSLSYPQKHNRHCAVRLAGIAALQCQNLHKACSSSYKNLSPAISRLHLSNSTWAAEKSSQNQCPGIAWRKKEIWWERQVWSPETVRLREL